MNNIVSNTQASYDQVAEEYAEKFKEEMDDKPFDRDCLDRLAREVGNLGPICDMGCGPGQIARYLHRQGVDTLGVDLSPRMVAVARETVTLVDFARSLGWPVEPFTVVHTGNIGLKQDLGNLVEAAWQCRADPGIRFVIVG